MRILLTSIAMTFALLGLLANLAPAGQGGRRRAVAPPLCRTDSIRRRCHDARRQGALRLPGMVQHALRRHELWLHPLGAGAGSSGGRPVHGRHVARRLGVRPGGPVRRSGPEDARRLAGPALQRLSQGTGPAALQVDAAVRDRRRLPQPVHRRGGQPDRARGMSTGCWPMSARVAIAKAASGR